MFILKYYFSLLRLFCMTVLHKLLPETESGGNNEKDKDIFGPAAAYIYCIRISRQ